MAGPYRKKSEPSDEGFNLVDLERATDDSAETIFTNRLLIELHQSVSYAVLRIDAATAPGSTWLWRDGALTEVESERDQRTAVTARLREMTSSNGPHGRINITFLPSSEALYDVNFNPVTGNVLVALRPTIVFPPPPPFEARDDHERVAAIVGRIRAQMSANAPAQEVEPMLERLWRALEFLEEPGRLKAEALELQAGLFQVRGDIEKMPEPLRARAAEYERMFGPTHDFFGSTLVEYGASLATVGRFDEAIAATERGVAIVRDGLGVAHPYAVDLTADLAVLYSKAGRVSEAVALAREVLPALRALFLPHPFVAEVEALATTT